MDGIAVKSVRELFCPVLSEISNINEYMEEKVSYFILHHWLF